MKHVNGWVLTGLLLLLSSCAWHREEPPAMKEISQSVQIKQKQQQALIGNVIDRVSQDTKRPLQEQQNLVSQWLHAPEALTSEERVRCVSLLLLKSDARAHLEALKLLTEMPDADQQSLLPMVEWFTAVIKNQIALDTQLRDMTQQYSDAQLKMAALENKIRELKSLESNLLSRPSENH